MNIYQLDSSYPEPLKKLCIAKNVFLGGIELPFLLWSVNLPCIILASMSK